MGFFRTGSPFPKVILSFKAGLPKIPYAIHIE